MKKISSLLIEKIFVVYSISLIIGCSLIEPSADDYFTIKRGTSIDKVFLCTESSLHSLKLKRGTWSDTIELKDKKLGILETTQFRNANIFGIRTQVRYEENLGKVYIKVKATDPYFSDLGAKDSVLLLKNKVLLCLAE